MPVQEVAEREQVTEVDRRVELNARECRVGLAVEQRVDPALRHERRIADGRRIGARELAAAQFAVRAMGAARRIGQDAVAVAGPAVAQDGLGYRVAARAAADQQHAVRDADEAPAELPAQEPGAVLVQAVRAEPRAADQHLVCLGGGCERRVQCPRWLFERAPGEPREQHPLDRRGVNAGRERDMLELVWGKPRAVASGREHDPAAAVQPERPEHVTRRELEGVRVAGDVAGQALPVDRGEPERQRPHAAARCGC